MELLFINSGEGDVIAPKIPTMPLVPPLLSNQSSQQLNLENVAVSFIINPADLRISERVGRGAFGAVYRGEWHYEEVAIKELAINKPSKKEQEEFHAESQKMARLRSNYIVRFYGYCVSPTYRIVMEYMPHQSLYELLQINKDVSWLRRYALMMDIAKGLAVLHAENILHRDLKSLNVLLDKNYRAKLSDFGLATLKEEINSVPGEKARPETIEVSSSIVALPSTSVPLVSQNSDEREGAVGTLAWMAPELFVEKPQKPPYSQKSDIYALGMVFWEIASGEVPYRHVRYDAVIKYHVTEGSRLSIPKDCPKEIATLIERCWAQKPEERPTAKEVVAYLHFKEEKIQLENKEEKEGLPNSYIINHSDLIRGKELGKGGYGVVYQGAWLNKDVAIKELLNKTPMPAAIKEFETEAQIMARLRSPNIVQFYGYCVSPSYCLVMEYMPEGSLYKVLHSEKPLNWEIRSTLITDMASGLASLHAENILHRDIKSLNVLLDGLFRAKLTDFGLSKIKAETRTLSIKNEESIAGTLAWTAPELFTLKPVHTKQSDVYSLGITIWEVASRKLPYAEAPPGIIQGLVEDGEREEVPEDCPPKIASLIRFCWHQDVKKRPEAGRVVEYMKDEKADDFEKFSTERVQSNFDISTEKPKSTQMHSVLASRIRIGIFEYSDEKSAEQQAKDAKARSLMETHLDKTGLTIGTAYSEGDCFFDGISQQLENMNIFIPLDEKQQNVPGHKKLRLLCDQEVKKLNKWGENNWIKQAIERDGQNYQTYLATIQYTAPEMEDLKKKNFFSGIAIWGNQNIEGRIICQKLSIKLHIIEIMIDYDDNVVFEHRLTDGTESRQLREQEMDEIYKDPRAVHLAVYQGSLHFVPIIKFAINQQKHPSHFVHDPTPALRK
jgi:serine/threonine protein kinase